MTIKNGVQMFKNKFFTSIGSIPFRSILGFSTTLFLSAVAGSNGGIWPCERLGFMRISGEWLIK